MNLPWSLEVEESRKSGSVSEGSSQRNKSLEVRGGTDLGFRDNDVSYASRPLRLELNK